jgi:hypothetical protein
MVKIVVAGAAPEPELRPQKIYRLRNAALLRQYSVLKKILRALLAKETSREDEGFLMLRETRDIA